MEEELKREMIDDANCLIDNYNETIKLLKFDNEKDIPKTIPKNSIEILMEYISLLPNIDRNEWYQDIEIGQVIQILESINYDENSELCKKN